MKFVDEVSIFAMEYQMSSISLAQAQKLIAGALAVARQKGYKPMGVVVVDTAAQAIAFAREDGASALRLDIAHGKAGAAIGQTGCGFAMRLKGQFFCQSVARRGGTNPAAAIIERFNGVVVTRHTAFEGEVEFAGCQQFR